MYIKIILLLLMLFCHIIGDYYLQGWLASGKERSWWEKNLPDKKYSNDYIMVLCEHAFSWTFMIMLIPSIYIYLNPSNVAYRLYLFGFSTNWVIHCIVDDLKANQKTINLVQDQLIHITQVILTWVIFIGLNLK